MARSFLKSRKKKSASEQKDTGSSGAPTIGGHRSAPPSSPPSQPVPVPVIGGHRAPPASGGRQGPAPIAEMRTWQAARPSGSGSPRGPLIGRARSGSVRGSSPSPTPVEHESPESESSQSEAEEKAPYNNDADAPAVYLEIPDEDLDTQTESEAEEKAPYNNDDDAPAVYLEIPDDDHDTQTESEAEEKAPDDNLDEPGLYSYSGNSDHGESEASETEDEIKYENDDDLPAPQRGPVYVDTTDHLADSEGPETEDETKYENDDDLPAPRRGGGYGVQVRASEAEEKELEEVEEQVEEQVARVRELHPERAIATGSRLTEAPAKKDEAPKDLPAVRAHRTWLVAKLAKSFEEEEGDKRNALRPVVEGLAESVATWYQLVVSMRAIDPADETAWRAVASKTGAKNPARSATTYQDALAAITQTYSDLLEKARREDLPIQEDGTLGEIDDRVVEYDHGADQERTKVLLGGRRLWRNDDARTPVDTRGSVTHHTGLGAEIFVVGMDNEIHMASHKIGKFHHSSLLGGRPVSFAGEMQVTDGRIDWLSNKSGHYLPSMLQFQQFLHILGKDVDLDFPVNEMVVRGTQATIPAGTTAAQLVAGVTDQGHEDEKLGYDHRKTQAVLGVWIQDLGRAAVDQVAQAQGWSLDLVGGEYVVSDGTRLVDNETVRKALKAAYPGKRVLTVDQKGVTH